MSSAAAALRAALALAAGFAALGLPFVQGFFDLIALGLTHLSHGALWALGFDLVRDGTELRAPGPGWAIRVTEVCDGHGIVIAWLAIIAALTGPWRAAVRWIALGFLAVQIFNFGRVIALALVLDTNPGAFEDVHLFLFPLLTTGLLAALALMLRPVAFLAFVGITAGVALVWYFATEAVSGAVLTPISNGLLGLFGPAFVTGATGAAPDWIVETRLLVSTDPVQLLALPFYPPDFAIALPVVLAAVLTAWRRAAWAYLALWSVIAVFAMAIGMVTAAWSGAEAQGIQQMIVPQGAGRAAAAAYSAPSEALRGLTELVQNVLVHFNLLVLPVLILGVYGRSSD